MTTTITLRTTVEWTDQQMNDHLLGSGATQWPWYDGSRCQVNADGTGYLFAMASEDDDDLDDPDAFVLAPVSREAIAEAIAKLDADDPLTEAIIDDDLDAVAADNLIQRAVYGHIVFC